MNRILAIAFLGMFITSCANIPPEPPPVSKGHLTADEPPAGEIPALVERQPILPEPQPQVELEHYTVVVNDVPVRELLFALARDASINVDIHPDISGTVTLNAVEQTLPQILDRISRQVNMRYEMVDENLVLSPDTPYFRTYRIDYVNLARTTDSKVEVAAQVATTSSGGSGGGGGGKNTSSTKLDSKSYHRFWQTLVENIHSILGTEDVQITDNGFGVSDVLVVNAESGLMSVKATQAQHETIQAFVDDVLENSQRQVLIEATIVEIGLNDKYQAGVNWSFLLQNLGQAGFSFNQNLLGNVLSGSTSSFVSGYFDPDVDGQVVDVSLRLLKEFGDTRVLSSPRLMVMNNQTAILKVVQELVYFTFEVTQTDSTATTQGRTNIETTINTVPVGLVMAVTPQINKNGQVTFNVRPSISEQIDTVTDPTPQLVLASSNNANAAALLANITNEIPIISTREMESVLKVNDGQVAILGGLMKDELTDANRGIPGLSKLPLVGDALFTAKDRVVNKSELVIFLRPVVIKQASLEGDLGEYRRYLQVPVEVIAPETDGNKGI
jgi:general secretion pathway protein D